MVAEVTELLLASSWMPLAVFLALLTGAQKWLREPASEKAKVVR